MMLRNDGGVSTLVDGARDCLPTIAGYISIGIAAGIVGASSKLSVLEIALLSATVYAGAAQFIICALLAQGSPLSVIVLTTFIVNLRHLLLSMNLAPYFAKYPLFKNIGIGVLLTDESFGVAASKISAGFRVNDRWMNGLNLSAYAVWILSCATGAEFGKWIASPRDFGLDFALTAMFVALLVLQLQSLSKNRLQIYLSLIVCTILLMIVLSMLVPSYLAVFLSTVISAAVGAVADR